MTGIDILYHDGENKHFWCLVTVANVAISNVDAVKNGTNSIYCQCCCRVTETERFVLG